MQVKQLIARTVKTCSEQDSLNTAAKIMWDAGIGCVPVVNKDSCVIGLITDRDICMAAYTQGNSLSAIKVGSAMAQKIIHCRPDDDVATAARLMAENGVYRLPVTEPNGRLIGLISLDDMARESQHKLRGGIDPQMESLVAQALGSIWTIRARRLGH